MGRSSHMGRQVITGGGESRRNNKKEMIALGCGKSFTMMGNEGKEGVIPRVFMHIMDLVAREERSEILLRCSFLEIYNEEIRDLLCRENRIKLEVRETPDFGVFVKGLS